MSSIVKKIELYKDFKKIIQVFKEPPFSEQLTEKEMIEEYDSYLEKGVSYGYYYNDEILGFIGILNGIQQGHPIKLYNSEEVLYVNGIAVLKDYRKYGIASTLMNHAISEIDLYKIYAIYLRTNYIGSKLENIALNVGFKKIEENGQVITEDVTFERNNGKISTDKRMFMIKHLKK
ncbi:MAG: GNAT family N-acetyltransferase [Bacilli bacterium]